MIEQIVDKFTVLTLCHPSISPTGPRLTLGLLTLCDPMVSSTTSTIAITAIVIWLLVVYIVCIDIVCVAVTAVVVLSSSLLRFQFGDDS